MEEELENLRKFFQRLSSEEENSSSNGNTRIFDKEFMLKDVENFDRFLKNQGGHTGGWSESDHIAFVNLSRRHNLHSVIYFLRLNFPDITEDEVIEHDRWYRKYIRLKSLQRKAVSFWRLQKCKKEDTRTSTPSTTSSNTSEKNSLAREKIKTRIQEWKEHRQQIKNNMEKRNKQKEETKAKQEELKRIKQKEKKILVLAYKEKKLEIQNADFIAKKALEFEKRKLRMKRANQMLPKYRDKDKQLIQKYQEKRKIRHLKEVEKQITANQLAEKYRKKIPVVKDPVRVLNSTFEWRQKTKYDDQSEDMIFFKEPLFITSIPHLAIPYWKKRINLSTFSNE